jgi:hypothetical protein
MTKFGKIPDNVGFKKFDASHKPKKVIVYKLGENIDEHGRKFNQTKQGRIY